MTEDVVDSVDCDCVDTNGRGKAVLGDLSDGGDEQAPSG